jgi:hypothetical protein
VGGGRVYALPHSVHAGCGVHKLPRGKKGGGGDLENGQKIFFY